jgi:WD40 repeat protein
VKKSLIIFIIISLLILCSFSVSVTQQGGNGTNNQTDDDDDKKERRVVNENIQANFSDLNRLIQSGSSNVQFINKSPNLDKIIGYGRADKIEFADTQQKFAVATTIGIELYSYNIGTGGIPPYEGKLSPTLITRYITNSAVNDFAFNPQDENIIAVALEDGNIIVINTSDNSVERIGSHGIKATAITYTPDDVIITGGSEAATHEEEGSADYTVRVWTGRRSWILALHRDIVTSLHAHPDGNHVVSGSRDANVIYSQIDIAESKVIYNHDNWVTSVMITPNGRYIFSTGADNLTNRYDLTNDQILYKGIHMSWINDLDITSDSAFVITGSDDSLLYSWEHEIRGNNKFVMMGEYTGGIQSLSLSMDEKWLGFISEGKELAFINIETVMTGGGDDTMRDAANVLSNYSEEIYSLDLTPQFNYAVAGYLDGDVLLWDLNTGSYAPITSHIGPAYDVAFSDDLNHIVSVGADGRIRLWSEETNDVRTITQRGSQLYSVAFKPQSNDIVAGSRKGLYLWDPDRDGETTTYIELQRNSIVNKVTYNQEGSVIAAGLTNGSIITVTSIIDDEGQIRYNERLVGNISSNVNNIKFSRDGQFIITGAHDGTLRRWNLSTLRGNIVSTRKDRLLDFSYDTEENSFIMMGVQDRVIGMNLRKPGINNFIVTEHRNYISSLERSEDNFKIATAGDDGFIKITDLRKRSGYYHNNFFDLTLERKQTENRLNWEKDIEDKIRNYPTQDEDNIYYLLNQRVICSMDKETGEQNWSTGLQNGIVIAAPAVNEDYVILSSTLGEIILIDKETGENEGKIQIESTASVYNNTSYYIDGSDIYFGTQAVQQGSYYYGINLDSREIFAKKLIPGNMFCTPDSDGEKIFIVNEQGLIYAFPKRSSEPVWQVETEEAGLFRNIKPLVYGDTVVFCPNKNVSGDITTIFGLDKDTGQMQWSETHVGSKSWQVSDGVGNGYLVDREGILKIALEEGELDRLVRMDPTSINEDHVNLAVGFDDNRLYFTGSTTSDVLRAYRLSDGVLEWSYIMDGYRPTGVPLVDEERDLVYLSVYNQDTEDTKIISINSKVGQIEVYTYRLEDEDYGY